MRPSFLQRCTAYAKRHVPGRGLAIAKHALDTFRGTAGEQRRLAAAVGVGSVVIDGPFAGMKYLARSTGSALVPKLLGTYESELHAVLNEMIATRPTTLIDIGAAEGYYAIGFARVVTGLRVVTFDLNRLAYCYQSRLAKLNNVRDRISIRGNCSPAAIEALLAVDPTAIILCDCEGAEIGLLDPAEAPSLRHATVLVETHDHLIANATATLVTRFLPTHAIKVIESRERTVSDFPTSRPARDADRLRAMSEQRPSGMKWLWMKPNT